MFGLSDPLFLFFICNLFYTFSAAILRVPGSINHKLKNGAKCEKIESSLQRYTLEEFSQNSYCNDIGATINKIAQGVDKVLEKCEFIKYCVKNAAELTKPLWHAMITNLAQLKGGNDSVHQFSKSYPRYSFEETERKIQRTIAENKPHTCEYIRENLNFDCGKNCHVKAPIVYSLPNFEEHFEDLLSCNEVNVDDILSEQNMKLCAWAKSNMPPEYAKLKAKLKGKINLRDFEHAVRAAKCASQREGADKQKSKVLKLDGTETSGAVTPQGWDVSIKCDIQKILKSNNSYEMSPSVNLLLRIVGYCAAFVCTLCSTTPQVLLQLRSTVSRAAWLTPAKITRAFNLATLTC